MKSVFANKSILVIDDFKLNYLIVKKTLEKFSMQINFIQDPRLAVDEIKKTLPDLILLDYEMPHVNGPELCQMIKADEKIKHIPVVFFTSAPVATTITAAFTSGADDYLNKPVCEPELLSRLNRIFQTQDLSRKLTNKYEEQVALSRLLSHDLNNYISIFKSSTMLLQKMVDLTTEKGPLIEKHLGRINNTITRMAELVLNVRNMQAIEDKKLELDLAPVFVGDVVKESISNFQEKFEAKRIEIVLDPSFDKESHQNLILLERISALNSVFGNILSNAVKFSHEGSTIDITCENSTNDVVIKIRDHGVGMPEELLQKIFSKTEKTTRSGTQNETGTGFGMPLVKLFMEKYGGNILVESKCQEEFQHEHGTSISLIFKKAAKSQIQAS